MKHALTVLIAARAAARYPQTDFTNNCNGGWREGMEVRGFVT